MDTGKVGSFSFSAIRPNRLGATEYTLVTIGIDVSSSIISFEGKINECLKAALKSCKHSPRREYLLVRLLKFGSSVEEIHGFVPLNSIDIDNYQPLQGGGSTALLDAMYSGFGAAHAYGKTLTVNNLSVNAASFFITDGQDVGSSMREKDVADELKRVMMTEEIESHLTVLIGINSSSYATQQADFAKRLGLSQYVDAGDANEKNQAKLAGFISRSISSQSSSLGTGGPSQPLTF